MEFRGFGQSGISASTIGLGTWPIGGARYGERDDRAAVAAIQAAVEAGVTCFDTAPSYGNGNAEELLGIALKGRRDDAVVITKGGLVWDDRSHVLGRNGRPEYLAARLDESLTRLGIDHVDLFLIHWPDLDTPLAETMGGLEALVASGKTRAIGVSNFTGAQLRQAAPSLSTTRLAANQISYSLFDRRWAADAFAACRDLEIGVMAYGPLAHGLLAGAFSRETIFDAADWRSSGVIFGQALLTPENLAQNLDIVDRLARIAADLGLTLPQLALAWTLHDPIVTVALVGARTGEEIRTAVPASGATIPPDALRAIDAAMRDAAGMTTERPV